MEKRSDRRVLLGVLAGVAFAAVLLFALLPRLVPLGRPDGGDPASGTVATLSSGVDPTPGDADPAETADADVATVEPSTPEADPPAFDTVRVEPDGSGIVAGQAEPGATVSVMADDAVAAETVADADGRFVAFLDLGPSDVPRALSLRDAGGALSEETVIVAPLGSSLTPSVAAMAQGEGTASAGDLNGTDMAALGPEAAAADPSVAGGEAEDVASADAGTVATEAVPVPDAATVAAGGQAGTADAADGTTDALGETAVASAEPGEERDAPTPPVVDAPDAPAPVVADAPGTLALPDAEDAGQAAVLVSDAEGVRVLQPALPPGADAEVLASVALDAISYDGAGEVTVAGRAPSEGAVRVYLDNEPVAEAAVGPDGQWSMPLTDAEPGDYTLRVDQIDAAGEVVSRIETPFRREARDRLAEVMADAQRPGQTILMRTVQPGNTLWAIARDRYGEPLMYVQVYEMNRDLIRDPDLIFPGQVFVLPATAGR